MNKPSVLFACGVTVQVDIIARESAQPVHNTHRIPDLVHTAARDRRRSVPTDQFGGNVDMKLVGGLRIQEGTQQGGASLNKYISVATMSQISEDHFG
jgi:hypothetical protein